MDADEYIKQRLGDQIDWYDRKSRSAPRQQSQRFFSQTAPIQRCQKVLHTMTTHGCLVSGRTD